MVVAAVPATSEEAAAVRTISLAEAELPQAAPRVTVTRRAAAAWRVATAPAPATAAAVVRVGPEAPIPVVAAVSEAVVVTLPATPAASRAARAEATARMGVAPTVAWAPTTGRQSQH